MSMYAPVATTASRGTNYLRASQAVPHQMTRSHYKAQQQDGHARRPTHSCSALIQWADLGQRSGYYTCDGGVKRYGYAVHGAGAKTKLALRLLLAALLLLPLLVLLRLALAVLLLLLVLFVVILLRLVVLLVFPALLLLLLLLRFDLLPH